MVKVLSWILALLLAVIAAALAIANRQIVLMSFDPLPWAVELPLYLLLFATLLLGLIVGMAAEWWRGRRWRREARQRRREAMDLTRELGALKTSATTAAPPAAARPELLIPPV